MNVATPITLVKQPLRSEKLIDAPIADRDILSPEMREYLMEKRRALLTELKALNKLLGLTTE